jgi:homoserine O-succinyltransferase
MNQEDANKQDARPLVIGVVNLLPDKISAQTEKQLLQPLHDASGSLQITPLFLKPDSVTASTMKHYQEATKEALEKCDIVIITGANIPDEKDQEGNIIPIGKTATGLAIIEVYRRSVEAGVTAIVTSCASTQVVAQEEYGIDRKKQVNEDGEEEKFSGVFEHRITECGKNNYLTRGLNSNPCIPHSRYNGVNIDQIYENDFLEVLMETSDGKEPHLIIDPKKLWFGFMGHPEYNPETLFKEWRRYAGLHFKNPEKNKFPEKIPNYLTDEGYEILENYKQKILEAIKNDEKEMPGIRTELILPHIISNWVDTNRAIWARILNAVYQLTGKKLGERLTKKRGINEKEFPLDSL